MLNDLTTMKYIRYNFSIMVFLFSILLTSCKIKNNLPDPLQAGWNNKKVCKLIEENKNVRVLKCTFESGVGHEKHYHKRHFGYTLAGSTFKITDANGIKKISPISGSHFYSEGTKWHEVLNIGDSTAVFLIIEPK
jgi:quercetin dioxygenase-like cupin family protein